MAYTYSLLGSSTVGAGGTTSINFTNIPQNYTDLCLKVSCADDQTGSWQDAVIYFNNDTTSYSDKLVYTGNGSSASYAADTAGIVARVPASDSGVWLNAEFYIPNYTGNTNKSVSYDQVYSFNGSGSTYTFTGFTAGIWSKTSAINSISFTFTYGPKFIQNSTAYLYGIRAGEY